MSEPFDHRRDLKTVAAAIAARLLAEVGDQWENYPEIGEHDWNQISQMVVNYQPRQFWVDEFSAAYDRLAARASEEA